MIECDRRGGGKIGVVYYVGRHRGLQVWVERGERGAHRGCIGSFEHYLCSGNYWGVGARTACARDVCRIFDELDDQQRARFNA